MENLPPLVESSKRCYCEVAGSLLYRDDDATEHPSVLNLPVPEIKELQRRAKQSGSVNQFLESPDEVDSISQFKLTVESDGVIAGIKGLLFFNSYSLRIESKWATFSKNIHEKLPTTLNHLLSSWYQKEILHEDAEGFISCFDWHNKTNKLAVALKDDLVKIFYEKNSLIPLLKHKRQVGINVIKWKPLVDEIIAVGCQDCCILWTIDPLSLSARPGSGCAQVIMSPSEQPIHSLSWDPNSCLLAISSKKSSRLEIWDSDREEIIYRKSGLTPIAKVLFNTNGERLLICGRNTITVFQCCSWKAETWSGLESTVEHAAWSSCGNHMVFAIKNKIFAIGFNTIIGGESDAKLLYDLPYNIRSLCWSNERLAVSLDNDDVKAVLLFNTQLGPSGYLRADINGWLPGPEKASLMMFKEFKYGSMLSIVYPSGSFNNIPFLYLQADNTSSSDTIYRTNTYINDTLTEVDINSISSPTSMIETSFLTR